MWAGEHRPTGPRLPRGHLLRSLDNYVYHGDHFLHEVQESIWTYDGTGQNAGNAVSWENVDKTTEWGQSNK